VLPVLAIFAAHAVFRLIEMARERRFGMLGASTFFLGATIVLVESVPAAVDRTESQGYWALGVYELQRGDPRAALPWLEESIRRKPNVSVVHQDLGVAQRRLGSASEAEASFREALRLDPGNAVAAGNLVDLLIGASRLSEAEPVARAAVARSPVYAPLRYDLGRLLYFQATGLREARAAPEVVRARLEAALAELAKGAELAASDPATRFRCAFAAGRVLTELGRGDEAVAAFERALAARPEPPPREASGDDEAWWWQCQAELLAGLARTGRSAEARGRREDLLRRFPGDPRAAELPAPSGS
jgi:tetratricopeptide (TPR) repeat protein